MASPIYFLESDTSCLADNLKDESGLCRLKDRDGVLQEPCKVNHAVISKSFTASGIRLFYRDYVHSDGISEPCEVVVLTQRSSRVARNLP